MEAGDRAAGDHDENERKDRRSSRRTGVKHRCGEVRTHHEQSEVRCAQPQIEQPGVKVVARLQQSPNRQRGGREGVHEQDHDPGVAAEIRATNPETDSDRGQHQDESDHRQPDDRDAPLVNEPANDDCDTDEGERREDGLGIEVNREEAGNRPNEHSHHEADQEEDDEQEDALRPPANQILRHLADAHAAMTHRYHQGTKIVNRADEQGSQDHPEHARQPAPDHGDRGSEHGGQAGDRGVVMAEQDDASARDVVDAVPHGVSGSGRHRIQLEDPGAQMPGVEAIHHHVRDEAADGG